jgi:hypothetical protein
MIKRATQKEPSLSAVFTCSTGDAIASIQWVEGARKTKKKLAKAPQTQPSGFTYRI